MCQHCKTDKVDFQEGSWLIIRLIQGKIRLFRSLKRILIASFAIAAFAVIIRLRYDPDAKSYISDFFSPFLATKRDIERRLGKDSGDWQSKNDLIRENAKLLARLKQLENELQQFQKREIENRRLRNLLKLPKRTDYKYLPAQIVIIDPISGGRKVRIDRGTNDGIRIGQPVLAGDYLYGRILETSKHSALILSIVDPNCKISVRIANTDISGILSGGENAQWMMNPLCVVNYLPRDQNYNAGMKIETSGLGKTIPPGIPVGTLVQDHTGKVSNTVENLYKVVYVKPLDLNQDIDFVVVIIKQ
jgi:rod shape-determining protein MreC